MPPPWTRLPAAPKRSTADTAIAASIIHGGPAWANWRRATDYYPEGRLLCKGGSTDPTVVPYDFNEIANDLNQTVKYDWTAFLNDRVNSINPHVDLEGIEQGGYQLIYADKPSDFQKASLALRTPAKDAWFSIGAALDPDGTISDVRVGGPADKANLSPGEKIMAVNGRIFSKEALHAAIRESKPSAPMHLILQNETLVSQETWTITMGNAILPWSGTMQSPPTWMTSPGRSHYLAESPGSWCSSSSLDVSLPIRDDAVHAYTPLGAPVDGSPRR